MQNPSKPKSLELDEDAALKTIVQGTATYTGQKFFQALVENLAKALNTMGAWVTEYLEECGRLRAIAFWMNGKWIRDYEYDIAGTPCEQVVRYAKRVHHPENVVELYPQDDDLKDFDAVSFMGEPLLDEQGHVLGHLAVLDTKPLIANPKVLALIKIFAARAAAEILRLKADAEVKLREEKLTRLVQSAMDAILELDPEMKINMVNPAAEKIFQTTGKEMMGQDFNQFLTKDSQKKLLHLVRELDTMPEGEQSLWIPGGLRAHGPQGKDFSAEATLSRSLTDEKPFHTLILRNVNERLEAEKKIKNLIHQTQYLRDEIKELQNFDKILGTSHAMVGVLKEVEQVATTDATVLILGETGTGKELIARAIHDSSARKEKPLIKVNCGAIPYNLMESEFFGHEPGAFTGATRRREGRFSLADGGTIFLDEVGELPLDLQVKLLRVLQEGEFEPVGSSKTQKVNVRIIAATNRNLWQEVEAGTFREDLYYRLNVFPIRVPALRDRGEDVILLAQDFADRFAKRNGRTVEKFSPEIIQRLKAYDWPGNVRELENVIERAIITSQDGQLNLDRALPQIPEAAAGRRGRPTTAERPVHTQADLEKLERENLLAALEKTGWRVSGAKGAARLLEMNPSTLSSRIKALGIERPRG